MDLARRNVRNESFVESSVQVSVIAPARSASKEVVRVEGEVVRLEGNGPSKDDAAPGLSWWP